MDVSGFQKITIRGNALARGRAHGEALRDKVDEHYTRWLDAIAADLEIDPLAYIERFLAETDFLPAIDRWAPDLLDEVRGIAEAANQPFNIAFARQLSDEEPWFRRDWKLAPPSHSGCTSLATWQYGGTTYLAQNMDMPHWCDGLQCLLHIKDEATSLETFQFTLAGKISLAGMNSAGLGMCCNTLSQLEPSKTGLPEDFVVRGFLRQATLTDGMSFLSSIVHASGQNYTVGEPGSPALNLECSANSIASFTPAAPPDCVYHSNHALVNKDQAAYKKQSAGMSEGEKERYFYGTSYPRFGSLEKQLALSPNGVDMDDIKVILASHEGPICRHGDTASKNDNFTLGCLIMELGSAPTFYVAPGPPCQTPFLTYRFT